MSMKTIIANERLLRTEGTELGLPIMERPEFVYTRTEDEHMRELEARSSESSLFRWQRRGNYPVASINTDTYECVLGVHRMADEAEVAVVQAHEMFHIPQVMNMAFYDWCSRWLNDHDRLTRAADAFPRCPVLGKRRMKPGFDGPTRMLERATDLYAVWITSNLGLYGEVPQDLWQLADEFMDDVKTGLYRPPLSGEA